MRQRVLRNAIIYENHTLCNHLELCADKLRAFIDENNISKQLIYAPLHMVSDILPTVLAGIVANKKINVISVHSEHVNLIDRQQNNIYGVSIEQFNPAIMRGDKGTAFSDLVSSLINNESNLVVFPDALPECTSRYTSKSMKTHEIILFGRKSHIHSGVNSFSRLLKEPILIYCLFFNEENKRLDVDILGCVDFYDVENATPVLIECGISKYSSEWIMWHYASFFGFNVSS
jgi:hypothetical protein